MQLGIGAGGGDDEDLARSGQLVDADRTEDLVLGEGDERVARPDDLVHPVDALGAIGQRRDRLGPTGRDDLGDAEQVRRGGRPADAHHRPAPAGW